MKKFFYSLIIVGGFTFYAVYQSRLAPAPGVLVDVSALKPAAPEATSTVAAVEVPVQAPVAADPPSSAPKSSQPQPLPISNPKPAPAQPKPAPAPVPAPVPAPAPKPKGQYADGQYTGSVADAYYGNIQVQVTVAGGKITDVVFLQYPNDRSTSRYINEQAMPYLKAEAIAAQSANVDIVSGATDSSQAFQQSLASALAKAKN